MECSNSMANNARGGTMCRHDFIVGILVKSGFRTSLKGFDQFCHCIELYSDDRSSTIESIYKKAAARFKCTKGAVEKNLRRLFMTSDAAAKLSVLFGMDFTDTGNKEIIAMFSNYIDLRRDSYNHTRDGESDREAG